METKKSDGKDLVKIMFQTILKREENYIFFPN